MSSPTDEYMRTETEQGYDDALVTCAELCEVVPCPEAASDWYREGWAEGVNEYKQGRKAGFFD